MTPKPSHRQWVIEPVYDEQGNLIASIDSQLSFRLDRLSIVIADIGGTVAVAADREEVETDRFETVRAIVRWESFAPARRRPREAPKPVEDVAADDEVEAEEPAEEPEPAAA